MAAEMAQFIQVMLVLLLAVVGSLLVWLHLRLNTLKKTSQRFEVLSQILEKNLVIADSGIKQLANSCEKYGEDLDSAIKKSDDNLQDLDYTIAKAEKILKRFDVAFDNSMTASKANFFSDDDIKGGARSAKSMRQREIEANLEARLQSKNKARNNDDLSLKKSRDEEVVSNFLSASGANAYGAAQSVSSGEAGSQQRSEAGSGALNSDGLEVKRGSRTAVRSAKVKPVPAKTTSIDDFKQRLGRVNSRHDATQKGNVTSENEKELRKVLEGKV